MPYAVTHVLLTIILVDLFRDYFMKKRHKRYLTIHTLFIAGVAGLLPDIDMSLEWLLKSIGYSFELLQHGGIFHTLIFSLVFLIPGLILWRKKKHKVAVYFFVIAFGVFFHILLDYIFGGGNPDGVMILWPFSIIRFKIHIFSMIGTVVFKSAPMVLDALILLLWLWHEEIKHKIKDFI